MKEFTELKENKRGGFDAVYNGHPYTLTTEEVESLDLDGMEVEYLTNEDKAATLAEQELRELKAQHKKDKMIGVEFDGVMCSATAKDQFGLSSIEGRIRAGMEFNFYFENGNTLVLNAGNVDAFEQVWYPFRMSFFP
jgi:hypothetical protein